MGVIIYKGVIFIKMNYFSCWEWFWLDVYGLSYVYNKVGFLKCECSGFPSWGGVLWHWMWVQSNLAYFQALLQDIWGCVGEDLQYVRMSVLDIWIQGVVDKWLLPYVPVPVHAEEDESVFGVKALDIQECCVDQGSI